MSCFICNKTYVRLAQHLKICHNLNETCIEPNTMQEFALMLTLLNIPKEIIHSKKEISEFLENKSILSRKLYCKLEKLLREYKSLKGMKPMLCIGKHKKNKSKKIKTESKSSVSNKSGTLDDGRMSDNGMTIADIKHDVN